MTEPHELVSEASLRRAGFPATEREQALFTERVAAGETARLDVVTRPEWTFLGGAALAALFAVLLLGRAQFFEAVTASGVTAAHLALGLRARHRRLQRASPDAPPEKGAFVDEGGELRPVLEEGEAELTSFEADGPERRALGRFFGGAQLAWGALLAGLPFALLAGREPSGLGLTLAGVGTFFGAAIFGRGLKVLFGTRPVRRFVVTSRRLIALAAPGALKSVRLDALRHRPVVVARGQGRATLALDVKPLAKAKPLRFLGLLGAHDLDEERAKAIAGAVMDARRALLEE